MKKNIYKTYYKTLRKQKTNTKKNYKYTNNNQYVSKKCLLKCKRYQNHHKIIIIISFNPINLKKFK